MDGKGCCKENSAENSCSTEKTGSCGDKAGACGTGGGKAKCCPMTLIKGAVVGGIVMFIWFSISWMVLPWHAAVGHVESPILIEYFLFCLLAAALLTKVLKKRREGCCPVAGALVIGLLVAVFGYVPNIIWMHGSLHDALVGMADDLIAITLAGAAIGKCVLKAGACTMGKCDDKAESCGDKTTSCH